MPAPRDLLAGYRPLPGAADEMLDAQGVMRPVWRRFVRRFARLSPAQVAERFERGNQYLRDAGVFFRQYSASHSDPLAERNWPLSPLPVILAASDWDDLCAGLVQRADLLETVMADLYGPGRLVAEGHLPAGLIAASPQWLRPMVGVKPAGGHFLHHIAFEVGRSPDGSWLVLGDRLQAPSGAGFALENRMATGRIFPEHAVRAPVHRLAGFLADFRAALDALAVAAGHPGGRAAILTPGPSNDTYFEHTYIARYLGLMLLEGEDLVVENGTAKVRTTEGLQPLGALWRRIDEGFADPLELNPDSRIGTPGLVAAIRAGRLGMVNALGAGVLEMRAMMAFLPRIAEVLTGKPLALPNIATWWLGGEAERDWVHRNAHRLMFGAALGTDLPVDSRSSGPPARIDATLGPAWVAQEAVALSTTPAWVVRSGETLAEGHIEPRPMTIRVFAARTAQGWRFMPGGYARIGRDSAQVTALAMQRGGSVADVWVVADRPVRKAAPAPGTPYRRADPGVVPARAADNLFWLGRYVERAEDAVRLVRAWHLRRASTDRADDPLLRCLAAFAGGYGIDVSQPVPVAVVDRIAAARNCAAKVRDRFSIDGWRALNDLETTARDTLKAARPGDDAARAMGVLVRKLAGFSGLVQDNMYRFQGWRFLTMGRALERADGLAALLGAFADPAAPEGALDLAVEVADSVLTHRRRFRVETSRETVVDLLALDADNPRSILFQLRLLREQAAALPGALDNGRPGPVLRAILPLEAQLAVDPPEAVTTAALADLRATLAGASDRLGATWLR